MKHLVLLAAAAGVLALTACDEPGSADQSPEVAPPPAEEPVAPAAEDNAAPTAAPDVSNRPPSDTSTLPPEKRTSEETVQPNSETLFY